MRHFQIIVDENMPRRFTLMLHSGYCLVIVPELPFSEIAALVRRLFRIPGFHTIAERMGKIVRITQEYIHWKELHQPGEQRQQWPLNRKR